MRSGQGASATGRSLTMLARVKIRLAGAFSWAGESPESIQRPKPLYESKTGPSVDFPATSPEMLSQAVVGMSGRAAYLVPTLIK